MAADGASATPPSAPSPPPSGRLPENAPSVECSGPDSMSAPSAAAQSIVRFMMSMPAWRIPRLRRNQVHRRVAHRRDRGPLQADPVEQPPERLVVRRVALEDRDLDAVIAGRFDVLEQLRMRLRHMRRPQQHAKADLHPGPSLIWSDQFCSAGPPQRKWRPAT